MNNVIILYILFSHFVADFVFQTRWQATNKSKSLVALTGHILAYMYTLLLLVAMASAFNKQMTTNSIFTYIVVNSALHWVTDFCTSKLTSYFSQQGKMYEFFVVIGLDQFIHQVCLITTLWILL